VANPLRHIGELARARLRRERSREEDEQTLGELEQRILELPAGLELEWLGVSGYRMTFEGQTLFVDPYFSRVPFADLLRRRPTLPEPAALDRFVRAPGEVAGVLGVIRTSTTRSTRLRSPAASAAGRTDRTRS
jgi:hypothetical protein